INSCSDCIRSGAYCMWCKQLNFTKPGEQKAARCDTWAQLVERGCMEEDIISPQNILTVTKNNALSTNAFVKDEPVQLRPQEVNLKLRPGFGSFVDKTEQFCQPAFGYRHVLSMTANDADFKREVDKQRISGNLDSPEGTLDAIMQAAVCGDRIGWRNSSTRLIVLTTDDGFHMAGDGKLAGILEPNDERCYMDNQLYTKSNDMDYPSVGQVASQLEKNNIQPIFAVTKNMENVYRVSRLFLSFNLSFFFSSSVFLLL
uniref:Integrin beta n=1 Tax=Hucho hucho TaxID=62062 RepID=A0A4W5KYX5_9TELE